MQIRTLALKDGFIFRSRNETDKNVFQDINTDICICAWRNLQIFGMQKVSKRKVVVRDFFPSSTRMFSEGEGLCTICDMHVCSTTILLY